MTNLLNNTLEFYMFSPLDQFGDDGSSVGLLGNMLADLITNVWYLEELVDFTGAGEVGVPVNWASVFLAVNVSVLFDDNEWEGNDMTTSGVQASIFSANIPGMVPGIQTDLLNLSAIWEATSKQILKQCFCEVIILTSFDSSVVLGNMQIEDACALTPQF